MRLRAGGVIVGVLLFAAAVTGSAGASTPIENGDPSIAYGGWVTVTDAAAVGGTYRASAISNDSVKLSFTGTTVGWLTRSGPDEGNAKVTLDGVVEGTVHEYAASPSFLTRSFSASSAGKHTLTIKVLGRHDPTSTGSDVVVDGFSVDGKAPISEDAAKVVYDGWRTVHNASASGGSYQSTSRADHAVGFTFTGAGVTWVTATGPASGMADVAIDGVDQGSVDLYTSSQAWQVPESYTGLADGSHTVVVTPLGTHNVSSTGSVVVLDAFVAIPAPTLTGITVTPSGGTIHEDQMQQYTATGNYSDGSQQDLTTQVTWSTSPGTVATISNDSGSQGRLTAGQPLSSSGTSVQVTATLGDVSGFTDVDVLCRLHSNGLGGTYTDCAALGTPGNGSTYTQQMAVEAAASWGHGTPQTGVLCGSSPPFENIVIVENPSGPSAAWAYTNTNTALTAGHVFATSGAQAFCPLATDPTWN